MTARQPRFAFERLDRLRDIDDASFAHLLGTNRWRIARWRRIGLTEADADRSACALGYHPYQVWPDWFSVTLAERLNPRWLATREGWGGDERA